MPPTVLYRRYHSNLLLNYVVIYSLDESGLIQVTGIEAVFERNITVAEQVSSFMLFLRQLVKLTFRKRLNRITVALS